MAQESIVISYKAQTRGFLYSIQLNNNLLEINTNGIIKKTELSKTQLTTVNNTFSKINFDIIENNISQDELAVDRAIKGIFDINTKSKSYKFELDHNNLPIGIQKLFTQLDNFVN